MSPTPNKQRKNIHAMKVSRLSLLDLLKHGHPAANDFNARVTLKLNTLSTTTIINKANSIRMVRALTDLASSAPIENHQGACYPYGFRYL
ncbi:hypothetical protein [Aeromonas veronii]|uniref:hypothetical protein n=1 Tax=Aeromonas veronii TaxID=654 RepID=UPI0018815E24|nr:hypothetical protein [Aeromonas veronii]